MVLEKALESPLGSKEIKPVKPKGNQPWVLVGRTDAEAEAPILWPPDAKSWLIGKDPDAGKYWRQEEKGTTEDEMVGWHHRLDGHEFEQALGVGDGQGRLECCSPWSYNECDLTEWLNWTDDQWSWAAFPVPAGHLCVFLGEMSIQVFGPFLNCAVCCLCYWIVSVPCLLWISTP